MSTVVVTAMWGTAWERYGQAFAESFARFWPKSVEMIVVVDAVVAASLPADLEVEAIEPLENSDDLRRFRSRFSDRSVEYALRGWKHDAAKWAPQGCAPALALEHVADGDILAWLDADVETFAPVPADLLERLLGDADIVHLGRDKWSEIGFWAIRVGPLTRTFVEHQAAIYGSGEVFGLVQQHSAFVFDHCLAIVAGAGARIRNLTPGGRAHVWFLTELGRYTDHKKGKRKVLARSPERPR